jgi:hypothetical protein
MKTPALTLLTALLLAPLATLHAATHRVATNAISRIEGGGA